MNKLVVALSTKPFCDITIILTFTKGKFRFQNISYNPNNGGPSPHKQKCPREILALNLEGIHHSRESISNIYISYVYYFLVHALKF